MIRLISVALAAFLILTLVPELSGAYEERDAGTTLFISLVPGFVVHGAGHFYMGEWQMGTVLLVSEGVAFFLWVMAIGESLADIFAEEETDVETHVYMIGANLLFYGSWAYDIIAPQVKLRKDNRATLNLLPSPGGARVGFSYRF